MKNWYVIFIKSGMENKLREFLCQNDMDAFYPMIRVMIHRQGLNKKVLKPLFPGYLFVESALPQEEFNEAMKDLKQRKTGIIKLLKVDKAGTPALWKSEQAYLETLLNKERILEHSTGYIVDGVTMIESGPLKGQEGKIIKIDRHKRMAILETELCGQKVQVRVSLEILSKS